MDIDSWNTVDVGIGLGILLLAIGVLLLVVAISRREKNIGCGLLALLLLALIFSPYIGLISLLYWYSRNIPEETRTIVGVSALAVGFLSLELGVIQYNNRLKKAGNTVVAKTGNVRLSQNVLIFLVLYCLLAMASDLFYRTDVSETIRQNAIWWILAIPLAIHIFFSFEFREKGWVYRGKVILFSDIEHAEWENPRDKTKLKIKLMNKERESVIKTPWEMNIQIDNYLRTNFPRP